MHPALKAMKNQARDMGKKSGIPSYKLRPYWECQVYRVRVPCCETADVEWRRAGLVVSLGELMQALGKQFTAKQVYYFYRALRIVALKRNKGSTSAGSTGAFLGMAASGLQAAQLRANLNKEQLVREYAAAIGVECVDTHEVFDEAVKSVYAAILRDMSPPWLLRSFPQALPGNGALPQCTRPSCYHTMQLRGAHLARGSR